MKKIIYRFLILSIILSSISVIYLSTIGIETDRLNKRISTKIKKIDKDLSIELKEVKIVLNPLKLSANAKTLGANLNYKGKTIQLEQIKSDISLIAALQKKKFILTRINISTKSLNLKNFISFIRYVKNDPKLFVAEKLIKNGYLIADVNINFDKRGRIKKDYNANGLIRNGAIRVSKKFNLNKIDFAFDVQSDVIKFNDINLSVNNKKVYSDKIIAQKSGNKFLISGQIQNEDITLDQDELNSFGFDILGLKVKKINFDSKSDFSFKLNENIKIKNLEINSKLDLKSLKIQNIFQLKENFPKIKEEIMLENHKIKASFKKDNFDILGSGKILLQDEHDNLEYKIVKNNNKFNYDAKLIIKKNLVKFDFLNFENNIKSDLEIEVKAKKETKKEFLFNEITLREKNNIVSIKNLNLSNDYKINNVESININYTDKENFKNKIQVIKKNKSYYIGGESLNINKIIENLLNSNNKKKSKIFNKNFNVNLDIRKIYLGNDNLINNFKGYLFFENNKVSELDLESEFSNQKKIKLTINTNGDEQITTLFSEEAKPLVDRYKFIKGFNQGSLDFYSISNKKESKSTLKIYDFKLKELPALTKILTLASLQGIADLLSGEGIRFSDFEMNFSNKGEMINIDEIYAIGPAISVLMNGYIKKDKLVSLRGTLVPATTINKTIGSIPILGDILVGKKIGEGVFGVSFKIKGPPKDLETSVNPIKTLTPRFITRTLEKIK